VALSGWGQAEDKEHSREAGIDVHLTKPVDVATLTRVLGNTSQLS
jgi:CheY-like chemotaxis protein